MMIHEKYCKYGIYVAVYVLWNYSVKFFRHFGRKIKK